MNATDEGTQIATVMGWSTNTLADNEATDALAGHRNGMLSTFADFTGSADVNAWAQEAATSGGSLLVALEPWDWNNPNDNSIVYATINGEYDQFLTQWFSTLEPYAQTGAILVRFAPEYNGSWRPWGVPNVGAETYKQLWNHVRAIQEQVAPSVQLMLNPMNYGDTPMAEGFPGANKVDVLGLDGYNPGDAFNNNGACHWQSYGDVFTGPIQELKALAPGMPWGVAEMGSAPANLADFEPGGKCYAPGDGPSNGPKARPTTPPLRTG